MYFARTVFPQQGKYFACADIEGDVVDCDRAVETFRGTFQSQRDVAPSGNLARHGAPRQPSTPVHLNPDAGIYMGLKIGRRSADLGVIDFLGTPLATASIVYPYPQPDALRAFLKKAIRDVVK